MKIFSIAFIFVAVISYSFISHTAPPATPIRFDDNQTGTYVFHNLCTNEDVDVTFRSSYSFRGSINGQKIILIAQYNEQQEGIGRTTGTRYIGHINRSDNQSANMVNGIYSYSNNASIRMVAPGSGNNFKSNVTLRYTFTSDGQTTSFREQAGSECQ